VGTESHSFGTNSMSARDSSATSLRDVAWDSPATRPEGTRRHPTCSSFYDSVSVMPPVAAPSGSITIV